MDAACAAEILIRSGYRVISRRYNIVSRIDRDISKLDPPLNNPDFYRLSMSNDVLVVRAAIGRLIPASRFDDSQEVCPVDMAISSVEPYIVRRIE